VPIDDKTYFEHLYKDYEALNARIDAYSKSVFDDTKLFAAVGAIFLWQPITEQFQTLKSAALLFFGFVAITFVVAVLEYRNLLKLSLIRFYMARLAEVEQELLELAERPHAQSFHVARQWPAWFMARHQPIARGYQLSLYATATFVPLLIIAATTGSIAFAGGYLFLAVCIFTSLLLAAKNLRR
jgi:hypothetical protein